MTEWYMENIGLAITIGTIDHMQSILYSPKSMYNPEEILWGGLNP